MFRLISLTASALALVTMLMSHANRPAAPHGVAQSVNTDSVTALLLTTGDLPGWNEASINAQANSNNGQGFAQVVRVFSRNDGNDVAAAGLISNGDGSALPAIALAQTPDSTLVQDVVDAFGGMSNVGNIQLAGSQSVGDQDQAAQWTATVNGVSMQLASDAFIRGNLVGFTIYGAAAGADPAAVLTQAVQYAQQQDAKLQAR